MFLTLLSLQCITMLENYDGKILPERLKGHKNVCLLEQESNHNEFCYTRRIRIPILAKPTEIKFYIYHFPIKYFLI